MTFSKKLHSKQTVLFATVTGLLIALCVLPACNKQPSSKKTTTHTTQKNRRTSKERRAARKQAARAINKPISNMTYQELREAASYSVAKGDKQGAILYKKRMIALCDTPEDLSGLMLDIADHLYDVQDAVLAGKMYAEFIKLYPGSEHFEYAFHRAIVCSFAQTLDPDRDQTKTRETLELTESFLSRPLFVKFRDAVKNIQVQCQKKLFDSEMGVVTFYTGRGDYKTALRRVEQIRVAFTPVMPEAQVHLLSCEIDIANKQRDAQKVAEKEAEYVKAITDLALPMPTGSTTRIASADKLKERSKPFMNRF